MSSRTRAFNQNDLAQRPRETGSSPFQPRPFEDPESEAAASAIEMPATTFSPPPQGHNFGKIGILPKPATIQPKLTIGEPNDAYEQEADAVSAQVMRMSAPPVTANLQRQAITATDKLQRQPLHRLFGPLVQREMAPDEEVQIRASLQRVAESAQTSNTNLEDRLAISHSRGNPLSEDVRNFMEPRLGADFSGVRVHTDSESVQMNRELGAQAFTHGTNVYYGAGKGPANDALTAHELTHVVQQTGGKAAPNSGLAQRMAQRAPAEVIQRAVTLDNLSLSTFAELASWYNLHALQLSSQQTEMDTDNVPAPVSIKAAIDEGKQNAKECSAKGDAEIDSGGALVAQAWFDYKFVKAMNEAEAEKAKVSAKRMKEAEEKAQAAQNNLDNVILPALRDAQRSSFRKSDDSALLSIADTIATVVDTSLITKDTILAISAERAELENIVNAAKGYKGLYPSANSKAPAILGVIEKANKVYAAFQLVRAGLDLVGSKKTASGGGKAGVKAMSTIVSAGGTLLNASAGMTLYANLYIGPMVDACLSQLDKLEDLLSKTKNRQWIELGEFDTVNWSIEPGGRPMFDFMLTVMRGSDSSSVPKPVPKLVAQYFVDNEDSFNAGTGSKNKMPTTGFWVFEDVDQTKIASWVFRHRQDLWSMLYGDVKVP